MKTTLKVSMLVLAMSSISTHANNPVLSIDDSGNEIVSMISDAEYKNVTIIEANALAQAADDQIDMALLSTHLSLKGIVVGLELGVSLGPAQLKT